MQRKSLVRRSVLMLFGTDSKIIPIESFIMVHVVIITMMENTRVHIGSAIFAFGCKIEINRITKSECGLVWIFGAATYVILDDDSRHKNANALNEIAHYVYHSRLYIYILRGEIMAMAMVM